MQLASSFLAAFTLSTLHFFFPRTGSFTFGFRFMSVVGDYVQ